MKRILVLLLVSTAFGFASAQKSTSAAEGNWKNAGAVAVAPSSHPKGKALRACRDLTRSGRYYLANDVSSAGTCFAIDADGIKLDLNGHTIAYDTSGTPNSPAIEGHDCWSKGNPPIDGPCGLAHGDAEIYNGKVVQAASASAFSPVFEFGQGRFARAPYIHDITATFQNTGAQFYNSVYLPPGVRIEKNTIYDNVTRINHPGQGDLSSRSAFQGQAITIRQNRNNKGVGDRIEENKIVGSPQGGVRSDNRNTVISGNDISMNATYTNDFCADLPAAGQIAEDNYCHPTSGRGFHLNSADDIVRNNIVAVTEMKRNMEYGSNRQAGCEEDGAYGVQVEFDAFQGVPPTGAKVTGNKITAVAGDCMAIGLRFTGTTTAGSAEISGNTVTTRNTGAAGHDYSLSFDGANGAGIAIKGNTFKSQYAYLYGDWDGYRDFTIGSNRWLGMPKYVVDAMDAGCEPGGDGPAEVCPVNVTFADSIPGVPIKCHPQSEVTVTIAGKRTRCVRQSNR